MNIIPAHNRLYLLEGYNTVYQYDVLCISETFLASSNITLSVPGDNLVCSDHPKICRSFKQCNERCRLFVLQRKFMPEGIYCSIPFSLLFIDFQVNQQLSFMTFNQILRNFLISLSNLNYTVLLYWVILMQDLIILDDTTINNAWATSTNVKSNSFITKLIIFH